MKTYEDLLEYVDNDARKMQFIFEAIAEHKRSDDYKDAVTAYEYYKKRNTAILNYQKLLYTISGEAVPDNYSANYKLCNAFFSIFVKQEVSYLLNNGTDFIEDSTKDKLGGAKFDVLLQRLAKYALWGGVAFGFWNKNRLEVFSITEFVPLWGEEDGALHAGIRFWQVDDNKPLRATLYEEDGYTEYMWKDSDYYVVNEKQLYQVFTAHNNIGDFEIMDKQNYPGFPVIPLWGNEEHQSELIGLREKIDCYDLIQSGFADDLDDCSQIFWTIQNAGGMDDIDLVKFVEHMKRVKAAVVDDEGSRAEAHTINVPYEARNQLLYNLRDSLYRDAMALDTDKISAGNVTATAIKASYENLDLKCDEFENCITEFILHLLTLIDVEDTPTFKRERLINTAEDTQTILSAAQFLDTETILKKLPFLNPDEVDNILEKVQQEEAERYAQVEQEQEQEQEETQEGEA